MRPLVLALAALLVTSVVVAAVAQRTELPLPLAPRDGGDAHDHDAAHDHEEAGHPAELPGLFVHKPRPVAWRTAEGGAMPETADAYALPFQFRSFRVVGDEGLREMAEEGYVAGQGTPSDPYVLDGFHVEGTLEIRDVTAPLVIRNSLIENQLRLNYAGPLVHVHHNRIHDLRVNENVRREAPNTGGLFEHNAIDVVGQLRHFGGAFHHNTIGPRPSSLVADVFSDTGLVAFGNERVWNFDGYHQAWVHNNTVLGPVEIKLHGHYHGSCLPCHAHNHADENEDRMHADHAMNHGQRHHALDFENNSVTVERGRALRVNDQAHAGDDRTANSEPNPALEDPHEHHTFVRLAGNRLVGGGLVLDVVNAEDRHHDEHTQEALVLLDANQVRMELPRSAGFFRPAPTVAYDVVRASSVTLLARHNAFEFTEPARSTTGYEWLLGTTGEGIGFRFHRSDGYALLAGTVGSGAALGVAVERSEQLELQLDGNAFGAQQEVRRGA